MEVSPEGEISRYREQEVRFHSLAEVCGREARGAGYLPNHAKLRLVPRYVGLQTTAPCVKTGEVERKTMGGMRVESCNFPGVTSIVYRAVVL